MKFHVNNGTVMNEEILTLLLKDIKETGDLHKRQIAVENYKTYCEAELLHSHNLIDLKALEKM